MQCPRCGVEIDNHIAVCPNCGANIAAINQYANFRKAEGELHSVLNKSFGSPLFLVYAVLMTVMTIFCFLSTIIGFAKDSFLNAASVFIPMNLFVPAVVATIAAWQIFSKSNSENWTRMQRIKWCYLINKIVTIVTLVIIAIFVTLTVVTLFPILSKISQQAENYSYRYYGEIPNEWYADAFYYDFTRSDSTYLMRYIGVDVRTFTNIISQIGYTKFLIVMFSICTSLPLACVFNILMCNKSIANWNYLVLEAKTGECNPKEKPISLVGFYIFSILVAMSFIVYFKTNWVLSVFGVLYCVVLILQGHMFRTIDLREKAAIEKVKQERYRLDELNRMAMRR